MYRTALFSLMVAGLIMSSCGSNPEKDTITITASSSLMDNPFILPSPLYLEAPEFDKIKDAHYMPAFIAGMRQQKAEIQGIANNVEAPTFDNTIISLERSGALLERVSQVFDIAISTNVNDDIQKVKSDLAPLLAQHSDSISLDAKLFSRIHAL